MATVRSVLGGTKWLALAGILLCGMPASSSLDLAFAQTSPLELLQRKQTARPALRGSDVTVVTGRRVVNSRGRGLFTSGNLSSSVIVVEPASSRARRQNRIVLAESGESPLDILLKKDRRKGGRQSASALLGLPGFEDMLDQPASGQNGRLSSASIITVPGAGNGETVYCVRLCDGYFFPVGVPSGRSNEKAQKLACTSLCPASETRLFSAPANSEGIEDAVSGDLSYGRLPNAYRYRTGLNKACTCNGRSPVGLASFNVLNDFTLAQGDVVMTGDGLRVLNSRKYPHVERSFVTASASKRLTAKERDGMMGIETGGRRKRGSASDRKQSAAAAAIVDKLLADEVQPADPQSLVRYITPNEDLGAEPVEGSPSRE